MKSSAINIKRIAAIAFAFFALFLVIIPLITILNANSIKYLDLDQYITVNATYKGVTKEYDSNIFDSPRADTTLDCKVKLPRSKKVPYSVLCFYNYNSVVNVYYNGQSLYSHGSKLVEEKRYTGHTVIRVPIPEEAWGNSILIKFRQLEDNTMSSIHNVVAMRAGESWLYPLTLGSRFGLISMAAFFVASLIFLVIFTIMLIGGTNVVQGIIVCLFCTDFSLWNMGYNSVLYLFSNDLRIVPYMEYFAMYLVAPLFCGYIYCECKDRLEKTVFKILIVANMAIFIIAAVSEHLIPWMGYISFLNYQNILMILSLFVCIWYAIRRRHDAGISTSIFRFGMLASMSLCLVEFIKRAVARYAGASIPFWLYKFTIYSLTPYIIFCLELTIFASYLVRILREYKLQLEKNQLEQIAYTDMLTRLPNRASVDDNFGKLSEKDNYAVIFFDVNHLKYANDNFGHEIGDLLLKTVADAIKSSCLGKRCFYGRYGGDEFIICLRRQADIKTVLRRFEGNIEDYNNVKVLPFTIEVAVGTSIHQAGDARSAAEVVHEADERMYTRKKEQEKDDPDDMKRQVN